MKIRTGFVSNSSSSSFCIIGYSTSYDELKETFDVKVDEDLNNWDKVGPIVEAIKEKGYDVCIDVEDLNCAWVGCDIDGYNIKEILELGIQADDNDKLSVLKKKLGRSYEPTVQSGEINT